MRDGLAHNDEQGRVHCHLCDFVSGTHHSFELAEAVAVDHLRDAHGTPVLYAIDDEDGTRRDTPR